MEKEIDVGEDAERVRARVRMLRGANFFFSSRRRHTRSKRDWSSDVCSCDLADEPFVNVWLENMFPRSMVALVLPIPATRFGSGLMTDRAAGAIRDSRGSSEEKRERAMTDRKSVVQGKSVEVGGGGSRDRI